MRSAAAIFTGKRDFRSFTADDPDEKSTTTNIETFSIEESGSLILVRIRGSHFLWKMVRQMVGVITEVGRGKMELSAIHEFFESASGIPAQFTAPPSGLFLERVYYKGDAVVQDTEPMIRVL